MCSQQCVGVQVKTLNCWLRLEFSRPPKFTLLTVVFNIIVIKYVLQFTFCSCHLCFSTVLRSDLDVVSFFQISVRINPVLYQSRNFGRFYFLLGSVMLPMSVSCFEVSNFMTWLGGVHHRSPGMVLASKGSSLFGRFKFFRVI